MNEFPEYIRQDFRKFYMSLPAEERSRISLQVINSGKRIIEAALR